MALLLQQPTMTLLHKGLADRMVHAHSDEVDLSTSVDVHMTNCLLTADRLELDFDLKHLWLTQSRWSMMCKQYVDQVALMTWLGKAESIGHRGRGMAVLRMKEVLPRGGASVGNKETRRWGGCMLAASYRALPRPTLTLHSRTSYIGYLGILDLGIAYHLGRYAAGVAGVAQDDVSFVWMLEDAQYHSFKSLAWLLQYPYSETRRQLYRRLMETRPFESLSLPEQRTVENRPCIRGSRNWMQRLLNEDRQRILYGDMTYNTYRRVRRRFHTERHGYAFAQGFEGGADVKQSKPYQPLPSVKIQSLDFSPIGVTI